MTARQKAYREFLKTDFWKALSEQAKARDGGCLRCGGDKGLNAHHTVYRKRWEDTLLEDLETLCRDCHRSEHGYAPSYVREFQKRHREILNEIRSQRRPTVVMWREFKAMVATQYDWEEFSELIFEYVRFQLADEREGHVKDWWMDREKNWGWICKAKRVRSMIQEHWKAP